MATEISVGSLGCHDAHAKVRMEVGVSTRLIIHAISELFVSLMRPLRCFMLELSNGFRLLDELIRVLHQFGHVLKASDVASHRAVEHQP